MNILVTGERGKIGKGFCDYLSESKKITPHCISLRGDAWKNADLSKYDAIYFCVGVVDETSDRMEEINVSLAKAFAEKAKVDGVKNFIYLSSMAVYGFDAMPYDAEIDCNTATVPSGRYGKSKLAGEKAVAPLADGNFHVHIVRAPSIYGRDTEAYLDWYLRMAQKGKAVDAFRSQKRSAIYIDNLSELIYLISTVACEDTLVYYYPQNRERLSVFEFIRSVAEARDIKCSFSKLPSFLETGFWGRLLPVKKIKMKHRAIAYSEELSSAFDNAYCIVNAEDSIRMTLESK